MINKRKIRKQSRGREKRLMFWSCVVVVIIMRG